MPDSTQATSPAASGDANTGSESDNISNGQAAAVLFKKNDEAQTAATADTVPAEQAEESPTPEQDTPVAESAETEVETQAQDTEPAEETTAEPDTGESEDDVLSNRTLDQRTKERIQKRIDKEVGRRKALESRLNEVEAILREKETAAPAQPAPTVAQTDNVPPNIAAIQSLDGLNDMRKNAKIAIRWAEEKLDAINDGEPAPEGWDRKTLKEVLRSTKIALEDHIPQREQFIQQRDQARQLAYQKFPFLRDRTSPEYQQAQVALRDPWLANNPNAEWIVGVQLEGLKAIAAKEAAAKAKAEAPKAPKLIPAKPSAAQSAVSSTGTATRAPGAQAKNALAGDRAKLEQKGAITTAEAAELLKRSEQLRNNR